MNALTRRATGVVVGVSTAATIGLGVLAPAANAGQAGPDCRPIVVPGAGHVATQCAEPMSPKLQACLFSLGGAALVSAATQGAYTPALAGALIGCGAMGVEYLAQMRADD
jgi:hypothetical protein